MVNQFDSSAPTGARKEEALRRATLLSENGWNDALLKLIARTPEEQILHNQIMFVPSLPRWTSARVVLVGDAAHGLSPHISAGGTLGVDGGSAATAGLQPEYPTIANLIKPLGYASGQFYLFDCCRDECFRKLESRTSNLTLEYGLRSAERCQVLSSCRAIR